MLEFIRDGLSLLGGAALFIVLVKLIGDFIRDRAKVKYSSQFDHLLEDHRHKLAMQSIKTERYLSSQYDGYVAVWKTLTDLQASMEKLWHEVNEDNVIAFAEALHAANAYVESWSIFFEQAHYQEIKQILLLLKNIRLGKGQLLYVRRLSALNCFYAETIRCQVEENHHQRALFNKLLEGVRVSFNKRLAGTSRVID